MGVASVALLFSAAVSFALSRHFQRVASVFEAEQRACPGPSHPVVGSDKLIWCYEHLYRPQVRSEKIAAAALAVSIVLPLFDMLILWIWFGRAMPPHQDAELPPPAT